MSYINFKPEAFSYLNIIRIGSELVQDGSECGFACLKITSCFSHNLAAFPDKWGKLLCELLPSDKHREPNDLIRSPIFHHFSKTVSAILFQFKLHVPSPLSKSIGATADRKVRN